MGFEAALRPVYADHTGDPLHSLGSTRCDHIARKSPPKTFGGLFAVVAHTGLEPVSQP